MNNFDELLDIFLSYVNRCTVGIPSLHLVESYFESLPEERKKAFEQNEGVFKTLTGLLGIQNYFTVSDTLGYENVNKFFYDDKFRRLHLGSELAYYALAAVVGFYEMPTTTTEEVQLHYAAKGINWDGKKVYRGLSFPHPNMTNDYINKHIIGEDIVYPSFTSTSIMHPQSLKRNKLSGRWSTKPIQTEIILKEDTQSKWVDLRKRKVDEGEILFPPRTKFRVLEVIQDKVERLPDYLLHPLLNMFNPTSEGGGYHGLTLGDILGEIEPELALNMPEFQWFFKNLRKTKLPRLETWNKSTPLNDLASKGRFKGGKIALYNQATRALLNHVPVEFRTGKYDVISAKIFLEEF